MPIASARLFLDTANQAEVEAAVKMGVICGVTTNPSLVAKEGGDYIQRVKYFCDLVGGPISVEVLANDAEGMLREARELAALHENIVIKLPITAESLAVIKKLASQFWGLAVPFCPVCFKLGDAQVSLGMANHLHENFVRYGSDVCTNERCICYNV